MIIRVAIVHVTNRTCSRRNFVDVARTTIASIETQSSTIQLSVLLSCWHDLSNVL